MKMGSPEYVAKLNRWTHLVSYSARTPEQEAELAQVNAELDAAELAHRRERNTIALAASDYDQARAMGDLGGTEGL